jgi:hypothetical protein
VKDGIMDEKWPVSLACDSNSCVNHRVLLHAANLRHGTGGFTSPPKEGMLWIFSSEKSYGFGQVRTPHHTTTHLFVIPTATCAVKWLLMMGKERMKHAELPE